MITNITEGSSHDDGVVAVLLVIVEDLLHRLNTWVIISLISLSCRLLVPIKDLRMFVCVISIRFSKWMHYMYSHVRRKAR